MKIRLFGLIVSATLLSLSTASAHSLSPKLKATQAKQVAPGCQLQIDTSRQRDLTSYKPLIAAYSQRHYAENTWNLDPKVIVLHYTVSKGFPWNLVNTNAFANETPGLSVHYAIQEDIIWQILPDQIRSRGAYGINHRAINIELVAMHANDLATKSKTLTQAAALTHCLMQRYQIPLSKVYSHQQVGTMDKQIVPEALDLIHPGPYHKIDPGEANMQTIKSLIQGLSD